MLHLPPEIWRRVLRFATLGNDSDNESDFDFDLCSEPGNSMTEWTSAQACSHAQRHPHTRAVHVPPPPRNVARKTALLAVCRQWAALAVEFVYEHVCIDDIDAFRRFSALINPDKGWWTKRIDCAAPSSSAADEDADEVDEYWTWGTLEDEIARVVECCPNLTHFLCPFYGFGYDSVPPVIAQSCGSALRHFQFTSDEVSTTSILASLAAFPHLESLALAFAFNITGYDPLPPSSSSSSSSSLCFPRLRALSLTVPTVPQPIVSDAATWDMPCLTDFTLTIGSVWHPDDLATFLPLLDAHGSKLKFLDITTESVSEGNINLVLPLCPNLSDLVIDAGWFSLDPLATPHSSISRIGVRHLTLTRREEEHFISRYNAHIESFNKANFPNLSVVRALYPDTHVAARDGLFIPGAGQQFEQWNDLLKARGIQFQDCTGGQMRNFEENGVEVESLC